MSSIHTTRKLISAYAESESGERDHRDAMHCRDVEEALAWGVCLFRGLADLEARLQADAIRQAELAASEAGWVEDLKDVYQKWAETSERILEAAESLTARGYDVEGLEPFRASVEEGRCILGNWELESEIPPIEDLIRSARPTNPRPEQYTD